MARTNKYASLNFNDIYEKKINNKQKSSSSPSLTSPNKTILSNSRIHGNMLVLSRPTPKHIPQPSPPPSQQHPPTMPDRTGLDSDSMSLRPLGRTGSGPIIPVSSPMQAKEKELSVSPKTNKFVPPHLRPGFAGREEKPVQLREFGGNRQGHVGSPNRVGENGRPKSGGGYEMKRGGESDPIEMKRPGSSGARPSSSGLWYGSFCSSLFLFFRRK